MYNAPILKKAIDIIKLMVKENKPLGVTEIARELSISKSTTFGILRSLEQEELVMKDIRSKRYIPGNGLFELSKKVLRTIDLKATARPFLERLVNFVDETIFLGVREDNRVRVLDVIEPQKEWRISSPVGTRFALTAGVMAKLFLSALPDEEIHTFLESHGLPRYTENTITDPSAFMREIEKTRAIGYAVDMEEYLKGMRAVGSIIYSAHFPVAVVWAVGFSSSMNDEKLPNIIIHIKNAAYQISGQLSPFVSQR
jgi:IclR family transcriptional regulator, KDG regulon repressor